MYKDTRIHVANNNVATQKFQHKKNVQHQTQAKPNCVWIVAIAPNRVRLGEGKNEDILRSFYIAWHRSCMNTGWKETHEASTADVNRPSTVQLSVEVWCFFGVRSLFKLCKIGLFTGNFIGWFIGEGASVCVSVWELDERPDSVGFCTTNELQPEFSWEDKNQDHAVCFDHDHRTGHTY